MTFENGVATFTLKDGESKTATGLAKGIGFTVEEEEDGNFTTAYTGETGTIVEKTTQTSSVTNTRKTGDLDIKKSVVSTTASDREKDFTFTVTLSDTTINKTFNGVEFKDGVATFTLKDGQTKSITGLPVGITYTVAEEAAAGFVTTKTGETGEISTEKKTAAFTNTKDEGGLIVNKSVVSDIADDKTKDFSFTVTLDDKTVNGTYGEMTFENGVATFTLKDGESKTASGLAKGTGYTVEETADSNFTTTYAGKTGTIVEKATQISSVTNTRKTGDLDVTKTVASSTSSDKQKDFTFTVTLSDKTINKTFNGVKFENGVATFTLKDGETKSIIGLPVGISYTVAETTADGFTTESTGETGEISIEKKTAAFTNTKEEGDLTVSKSVESDLADDKTKDFSFTVTLDDKTVNGTYGEMTFENGVATFTLKDGESKTASGLAKGTGYTVEETADSNFTTTYAGKTGTIVEKATQISSVTNTRKTGDLDVTKTVASSTSSDKQKDFTFTVTLSDKTINKTFNGVKFENGVATFTLKDSEKKSITGLPVGITYTVAEEMAAGYVTTKTGETGEISIEKKTAAFTNTKEEGDLTVSKSVESDLAADKTKDFSFTVTLDNKTVNGMYGDMTFTNGVATFTLKDGENKTATGLAKGIRYTVTEKAESDFATTYTGETGTISETAGSAAFTNTRKTGDLTLSKKVVSEAAADKDVSFTFTVELSDKAINKAYGGMTFANGVATVTLKDGEKATATGLPIGITYTITEAEAEGFELTAKTGDTGTISTTKSTASFTNTRETGDLELSKTVVSDAAADKDAEFTFTVTLSDTTIGGTYGDMTFTEGVATVTLKGGQKATATDLPTGITYTITEATTAGFQQTGKTGDTGMISTTKSVASFKKTR